MKRASLLLCMMLSGVARGQGDTTLDRSIVSVQVTHQAHDAFIPWQRRDPGTRAGYAIAVATNRLLATEALVRNHTMIEVQLPRAAERIAARVVEADPQIGLALLELDTAAPALTPLSVDASPAIPEDAVLTTLQLDHSRELQTGTADVLRKGMGELPDAPFPVLTYTLLNTINVNGKGAAVLRDGKLMGLVNAYQSTQRTSHILPGSILAAFLDDIATPPYRGFAMAGFVWSELVDPTQRRWLGVTTEGRGIQILATLPATGARDALQPGDVILSWDGYAIDNLGFYDDPDLGRISFSHLIKFRRRPGDTIDVSLIRDGAPLSTRIELARYDDTLALIPDNIEGRPPPYIVEGGLIFRELTGDYLKARGGDWVRNVDTRLAHIYFTQRQAPEQAGQRVVVLSAVLPDPVNLDYGVFRDDIVEAVNGDAINNIGDMFRILARDGHITHVRLRGIGVDLVFNPATLPDANARIARLYRIPQLRRPPENDTP